MSCNNNSNYQVCQFCIDHPKLADIEPHDFLSCRSDFNVLAHFYQTDRFRFLVEIGLEKAMRDFASESELVQACVIHEIMKPPRVVSIPNVNHVGYCQDITIRDVTALIWDDALGIRNKYGLPKVILSDTTEWHLVGHYWDRPKNMEVNTRGYRFVGSVEVFNKFKDTYVVTHFQTFNDREPKPCFTNFNTTSPAYLEIDVSTL